LVLKENRGGSRAWNLGGDEPAIESPAFPTTTTHSVGVGDCFNGVWVAIHENESIASRARIASHIASIYASTFDHAAFVKDVRTAESVKAEILELRGVRLPWERRPEMNIYLAAPDFPYVDTEVLERISEALRYHNFSGHRPIQENGLAESSMSSNDRRSIYSKDMELLAMCNLLIAIPLTEDPGTYAELGLFSAEEKPTILYDPHRKVTNTFVLNTASRVCFTITEVIDSVFELLGRQDGD
jgi:nucleoside 2-deoxyribosyltransferase